MEIDMMTFKKNTEAVAVATTTTSITKRDITKAITNGVIIGATSAATYVAVTTATNIVVNKIRSIKAKKAADNNNNAGDPTPNPEPTPDVEETTEASEASNEEKKDA